MRTPERQYPMAKSRAMDHDGPIETFTLPSGHRVSIYRHGDLGVPSYHDHQLVLIEDRGSHDANREAALSEVVPRQA
jgi:hypothetical protein